MTQQRNNESTGDSNYVTDSPSKRNKICVMLGSLLNVTSTPILRPMPLSLDNGLPAAVLRFGSTDDNKVALSCHIDSHKYSKYVTALVDHHNLPRHRT